VLENFDMSLGSGLSKLADRVFRIGHLGDFNDLALVGALAGVEMGLELAGVPFRAGGTQAAIDFLAGSAQAAGAQGKQVQGRKTQGKQAQGKQAS